MTNHTAAVNIARKGPDDRSIALGDDDDDDDEDEEEDDGAAAHRDAVNDAHTSRDIPPFARRWRTR